MRDAIVIPAINGVKAQGGYIEPVDGSDSEDIIVPMTGVLSLATAGNITMACGGFAIAADDLRLTAITVDTIY